SNYRVEDLVRDVERTTGIDAGILQAAARVTERSRTFFSALAMNRMQGGPPVDAPPTTHTQRGPDGPSARTRESKARYTSEGLIDHFENGIMLCGALEGLEASLALVQTTARTRDTSPADAVPVLDEAIAALARRAGDLHKDLRFLLRAND